MANPLVPLPPSLAGPLVKTIILDPLDDPAGIPTNEEIVRENRLLLLAQHSQQFDGINLTDDEYGNAIVRHHRILSTRSDHDRGGGNAVGGNNAATTAQLTALGAQLTAQLTALGTQVTALGTQVTEGLTQVTQRLDRIEVRMEVNRARSINSRIPQQIIFMNAEFINIVKYTIGHPPDFFPVDVDNVNFAAQYNIGDQPPENLVPRSHARFEELKTTTPLAELRRILRAIFWFYNDPTLQLAANTTRRNCMIVLDRVKTFIVEP